MLEELNGVGPKTIKLLNKLGINDKEELINYYPFRFDIMEKSNIDLLNQDDKIIIDGIVEKIPTVFYYNKKLNKMDFILNTGINLFKIIIFNRAYLKTKINIGSTITIIGKYDKKKNTIIASDIKLSLLPNKPIIEPIYHVCNGITSKEINKLINNNIDNYKVVEYIPNYLIDRYKLINKYDSIKEILSYLFINLYLSIR